MLLRTRGTPPDRAHLHDVQGQSARSLATLGLATGAGRSWPFRPASSLHQRRIACPIIDACVNSESPLSWSGLSASELAPPPLGSREGGRAVSSRRNRGFSSAPGTGSRLSRRVGEDWTPTAHRRRVGRPTAPPPA